MIFDLDDTLYPEITFVNSGLEAVAVYFADRAGVSSDELLRCLVESLSEKGRGAVFDDVFERYGILSAENVHKALNVYRSHEPNISLPTASRALLQELSQKFSLYVVTDGNKLVQSRKVKALGLDSLVKRVFITHRFGLNAAKPSLHCFDLIRKNEVCLWSDMVYVGDDPSKDFVSLNRVGAKTIRVLQGRCAEIEASPEFDGQVKISGLDQLNSILKNFA